MAYERRFVGNREQGIGIGKKYYSGDAERLFNLWVGLFGMTY